MRYGLDWPIRPGGPMGSVRSGSPASRGPCHGSSAWRAVYSSAPGRC